MQNASFAHGAYATGQVAASSPVRIVVLLYDGAIRFCRQSLQQFDEPSTRGGALGRAHAIVSELLVSLDMERGGEVAEQLDRLYRYVLDCLIRANLEGDRRALESSIQVLTTLSEGWHGIYQDPPAGAGGE